MLFRSLPFDVPGFGFDSTPAERTLPPLMERTREFLRGIKRTQVERPVVRTIVARTTVVLLDAFDGWRAPLLFAFLLGLGAMGAPGWFAFGTGVLLMVAYGAQAHTADWTVYYLEALPALAFTTAIGVQRVLRSAPVARRWAPIAGLAVAALVVQDISRARTLISRLSEVPRHFTAGVAALPKRPNLIFVRYSPRRSANDAHIALVANAGVLAGAPSWIVHDRGSDNQRLQRALPGRIAYLYDEESRRFTELVR